MDETTVLPAHINLSRRNTTYTQRFIKHLEYLSQAGFSSPCVWMCSQTMIHWIRIATFSLHTSNNKLETISMYKNTIQTSDKYELWKIRSENTFKKFKNSSHIHQWPKYWTYTMKPISSFHHNLILMSDHCKIQS